MLTINPAESRKIIESLRINYQLDLSDFGQNLLWFRINQYLGKHLFKDTISLLEHLHEDETHLDEFLAGISAGSWELFRDPAMWKHLREKFIPELTKRFTKPVIWLPRSVSGHDAFSILLLLADESKLNNCQIYSSTSNFADLKRIQNGKLGNQFLSLSHINYLKSGGKRPLDAFLDRKNEQIKPSLIRKITFTRHFNMLSGAPERVHMIILRNQLMNLTLSFKTHLLSHLTGILPAGGFLVLGIQEKVEDMMVARKVKPVLAEESIYQKPDL